MLNNKNMVLKMLKSSPILVDECEELFKYQMNEQGVEADTAYHIVKDQLLPEGNARQNLATFCQTYMEPQAVELIAETLNKNAIDKSLYTQTADIEDRCVEIIANLWHRPQEAADAEKAQVPKGTSTIGSSEACMLAGMAMKVRWQEWAEQYKETHPDFDIHKKPNLVLSSGYQVCWEKFEKYWDVDLVQIPMDETHMSLNPDELSKYINEYTIGVVAILGITYTGLYDDVGEIDKVLSVYNDSHPELFPVQIHVDGASGAFYEPFVRPDYEWDFRVKNVISINGSGHKYGLVYPGVGWVIWRASEYLPQKLTFEVSYLGGTVRTVGINFSKSAGHIVAQYYNFIRLGMSGYKKVHEQTKKVSEYLEDEIKKITISHEGNDIHVFELLGSEAERAKPRLPLVCWKLTNEGQQAVEWRLADVSDRLLMRGWQIPSYPLPNNLKSVMIQRIVCRADLSMELAEILVKDIKKAVETLCSRKNNLLCGSFDEAEEPKAYGFTH